MELKKTLDTISGSFWHDLKSAKTESDLEAVRLKYLSRNGIFAELMSQLKELSLEEKKEFGPVLNTLKQQATDAYHDKQKQLLEAAQEESLKQKAEFDVTAYKRVTKGTLHPLTHVIEHIENIFTSMGYIIADGPEVETPFYNFEALNIPADHPAREMHDTFWLKLPNLLLRTHTSSIQIHSMQKLKPPFAICAPGRAYRHEATDATHDFVFNQVEGLVVDKNISVADLLGTVKVFMQALFNKQTLDIRVRPSYFPFVEPGLEVDITCPFCISGCSVCKKRRWIELGGAGLVHPNVLKACGIDPQEWGGFAFGLGIERFTMLKYQIPDIRLLKSSKIEFLNQF
jgi:phenylalanyl-tRNA synthetase alpha chain